jgi:hypothetical protein
MGAKAELLLDEVNLSQCGGSTRQILLFWQRVKPLNHCLRIGMVEAEAGLSYCDRLVVEVSDFALFALLLIECPKITLAACHIRMILTLIPFFHSSFAKFIDLFGTPLYADRLIDSARS